MKIAIRVVLTFIAFIVLSACSDEGFVSIADQNAVNPENELIRIADNGGNYEVWLHKPTGCHFLATGSSYGGFTQIIQPNGKPYCPGE